MAGRPRNESQACVRRIISCRSVCAGATALAALLAAYPGSPAWGGPIPQGDIVIELETVASGLTAPVGVTHAGDGSGRLFIVEQSGQIRILENGVLLTTPFLDISNELPALNAFFDERGLLGLAFHPDYENNGRFFVRHSVPREGAPDEPCADPNAFIPGCHIAVLAEYAVSAADPNVADPSSRQVLFSVDEPQFNHNSGEVAFGPDGFLYFTLGDGGGANDGLADDPISHGPIGNGQNIETVLGSILRIDVDGAFPYVVPPDNPFVGVPGADEIYAYGMRNPYKFSFDDGPGGDGSLYLGDVGQNLFEEVNIVEKGGNYGWVIREGLHCFDPFNPLNPPAACAATGLMGEPLLDPIVEYSHPNSGFDPEGGITVIGGFVYRGSCSPGLSGTYVFGDFAQQFVVPSGSLYFLEESNPGDFAIRQFQIGLDDRPYGLFLKGFGEDENGEVYACGSVALAPFGDTGVVQRIVVPATPHLDIKPGSCPNSFNRQSGGVLSVALLGSEEFDASQVDLSILRLSRADGVGGSVSPHEGPPGPRSVLEDVASPFDGLTCDCHDLDGDGVIDLSLKFRTQDVVEALGLEGLSSGALVELVVTGKTSDGCAFASRSDCVRLVPPGTPPGLVSVRNGVADAWVSAAPLDLQLDGGGFGDFDRTYPLGTIATFAAEPTHGEKRFVGWKLEGSFVTRQSAIDVVVTGNQHTLEGILLRTGDMNGDDRIDLSDFADFAVCFGSSAGSLGGCSAESHAASDFNADGKVDLQDFAAFAVNFGS